MRIQIHSQISGEALDYQNYLDSLEFINWREYENPNTNTFHSSIVSGDITIEKVNKILKYLENNEKHFQTSLDNITIYKFIKRVNDIKQYKEIRRFT
jgi:hypothetical protein